MGISLILTLCGLVSSSGEMRQRITKTLLVFALILAACVVGALILSAILPTNAPPPLPTPNGYTALIQAAAMMTNESIDFSTMDPQQLRAFVEHNTNALQLVRSALKERIQTPTEFSVNYNSTHLTDVAGMKRIAHALLAEGRLAEMEQLPPDAANSYLDTIRLGVECRRGGILIDALVGLAIEEIGRDSLQKLIDHLDQKSSKEAARRMEEIEAQGQTWEQILQQEHYWSYKTFPAWQQLLEALTPGSSTKQIEAKAGQKFNAQRTKTRKLMIELAARAYELENGHKPGSMNDLIPAYLKEVPQNPSTSKVFTYPP